MPRETPPEEIDDMSNRIDEESGVLVQDRDSFDLAINNIWELKEDELSPKQEAFRDDVFRIYISGHPEVRPDRLHKKGLRKKDKGFTLRKDRETTEKVVRTDKEFIEKGSKRFDFAGFDIKESEITKEKVRARKEFVIPAIVKNKVVFVRKDFVTVKGREQVRFRDSKGRFASTRIR